MEEHHEWQIEKMAKEKRRNQEKNALSAKKSKWKKNKKNYKCYEKSGVIFSEKR